MTTSREAEPITYRARWVIPGGQAPPIENGLLTTHKGIIQVVEQCSAGQHAVDLGDVIVLPAFVNAHTHLDLSFADRCRPNKCGTPFVEWLKSVIAFRKTQSPNEVSAAIRFGVQQAIRFGTGLLGEIQSAGESQQELAESPLKARVYRELIGLSNERATVARDAAAEWLASFPATESIKAGLSPHAPYSAHLELYRFAVGAGYVQSHIAECEDEGRWLGSGDGAFMEFLAHLGIATPPVRPSWSEFISILTECKRAGIVHSTELPVESWQHSSANVICVYCPRTHAILSQTPHPFPELVKRGIPICLGTDSLASNPDLDPLAEGIFLKRRHPWLQGADLLDMLTTNGAQLLGFDHWVGRLAPSFSADCVVLPYIGNGSNDPYDQLFDSRQLNAARGVMLGGEWHYVPAALKSFILTHSAKGR